MEMGWEMEIGNKERQRQFDHLPEVATTHNITKRSLSIKMEMGDGRWRWRLATMISNKERQRQCDHLPEVATTHSKRSLSIKMEMGQMGLGMGGKRQQNNGDGYEIGECDQQQKVRQILLCFH